MINGHQQRKSEAWGGFSGQVHQQGQFNNIVNVSLNKGPLLSSPYSRYLNVKENSLMISYVKVKTMEDEGARASEAHQVKNMAFIVSGEFNMLSSIKILRNGKIFHSKTARGIDMNVNVSQ